MLNPFWPPCPRLHHGIMVADPCHQGRAGHEWVCRICGTRLYGNAQGEAHPARITYEQPVNANTGNHTGKPRNAPSHYGNSKERNRNHMGKWYE